MLLSVNVSVAFRVPTADGMKVTVTVQLVFTARVAGEMGHPLLWITKSAALGPLMPTLLIVNGAVPSFKRDSVAAALVVPTG